jgi:hypothetical protein
MPTTSNHKLTITKQEFANPDGTNLVVEVTYKAHFSRFDRNLARLGLLFREKVTVFGVDPPGSKTGTPIFILIEPIFGVTPGDEEQIIERKLSEVVPRNFLDEDPGTINPNSIIKDDDEIRCSIQIITLDIPPSEVKFTNQVILFENAGKL